MRTTKNILLATNATTAEEIALIKAAIQQHTDAEIKLNLVHVIPNLPTCYFNIPSAVTLAERYYDEAEACLSRVGQELGVEKKNQWLITGRVKTEVLKLANKLGAQFILAGGNNMHELRKSVIFRKDRQQANIQSINNLVRL